MSLKFHSIKTWIATHRIHVIVGVGALLIALSGAVTFALLARPLPPLDTTPITIRSQPKRPIYSPLTGLEVARAANRTAPVTAIMIENSPDARPQSGLKDAEIVYEAIAEGGITRFMALYQQNKPTLVGPVRSVRPYFIDWFTPYDASFVHVGGSAAALRTLRGGDYRDLDQFFNASAYWRASDRYAPHNVYTNFKKIDALNKSKGYKTSKPKEFERTTIAPAKVKNATSISVHISSSLFDSSYAYNAKKQYYTRSQAGAPHTDREKGTLQPKVIIVMKVRESEEFQDTNREVIQTTGKGEVTIFQGGTLTRGTWQRNHSRDQFQFTDKKGRPIKLDRGQTWITAIPASNGTVSWK